ncbi:hypothetical protein GCM10010967_22500 [Dyadobacter beijingensis]|uniref:Uncharacterized protein n=1 Tax=Dyadobacter beijingensis TaxID=365489 RepID=A0ABQ2HR56_9BACT|nr:hypothetical protein [Dyadobacter beijingensis]GGM89224.1 hypothetical protein GCM10010967_22500 [Dyadobacter beijingensis]
MKTLTSLNAWHNVLAAKLVSLIVIGFLLIGGSCTETEIKEYEIEESCFTKESLETVSWVKDQLNFFQVPKQGPLRVAVYQYRDQYYLAFENPSLSSPMSYIFNCDGKTIGEVNIHYNEFYGQNELMSVLLEAKY